MTESVIEALENRQQASGETEGPDVAVGAGLAPPGGTRVDSDTAAAHGQENPDAPVNAQEEELNGTGGASPSPTKEMDPGILKHLRALHAQAEELKRDFPDFDLDAALHDPAFLRLTAPALGVGVREAFYALNRPRLDALAAARAAEESRALLARAVSGGAQRPREGGGSGAAALLRSDYAALSRERQLALKQRIREAAARGEKMYP